MSDASTHSSFGVPTPCTARLQRLFMSFPRLLLMPMSVVAVLFETLAPLVLLAPAALVGAPFAAFGVKFHYGICLLQNIDFVSWWGPMYAFFLTRAPTDGGVLEGLPAAAASFELAPLRSSLAVAYVVAHCVALVVLRFFPKAEILPFSCFPMFKQAVDLFDPACRKWHWLSEKPHATGTLKNYCFPFCRAQTVREDELPRLPFKYLLVGHGGSAETTVLTKAQLTPQLSAAVDALCATSRRGRGAGASDAQAVPALLA